MKSFVRNALLGAAGLVALSLPTHAASSTAVTDAPLFKPRRQRSPCCWPNGTKIPAAACSGTKIRAAACTRSREEEEEEEEVRIHPELKAPSTARAEVRGNSPRIFCRLGAIYICVEAVQGTATGGASRRASSLSSPSGD